MATATPTAGKRLSKSQLTAHMAAKTGITRRQASIFFKELARLAYTEASNSFVIPGLGKLELKERNARKMTLRFGADAGKQVIIPKKRVVKFRVARAAQEAILKARK